jgi:hypothetical protein
MTDLDRTQIELTIEQLLKQIEDLEKSLESDPEEPKGDDPYLDTR